MLVFVNAFKYIYCCSTNLQMQINI